MFIGMLCRVCGHGRETSMLCRVRGHGRDNSRFNCDRGRVLHNVFTYMKVHDPLLPDTR